MSFLTDPLPHSLNIHGVEYPIDTDFRTILRYDEDLQKADESLENIARCLKRVFVTELPPDPEETVQQMLWFIRGGKTEEERHKPSKRILGINSNTPFDFHEDGEMIYSAFRRNDVYGLDLRSVPYLHWWEFLALVNDLPEDVQLSRVILYRTIDTGNKDLDKKQADYYRAMQRYYKLENRQIERNEELIQALKEGRDVTPYLERGE